MKRDEKDFVVFLKRLPGYEAEVSIRFEANNGHGVIGLGARGGGDSEPASLGDRAEIRTDVLRAGRFIHVLPGSGRRQSYSFSRLSDEELNPLPDDRWVPLDTLTEFGFRYLIVGEIPDEADSLTGEVDAATLGATGRSESPRAVAAVAVGPAAVRAGPPTPAAESRAATPRAPSSNSSSSSSPRSSLDSVDLPPRPVAVQADLAQQAMAGLSREEAIRRLQTETAKVSALLDRVVLLERNLVESQQRERDLLDVIGRWQHRASVDDATD